MEQPTHPSAVDGQPAVLIGWQRQPLGAGKGKGRELGSALFQKKKKVIIQ